MSKMRFRNCIVSLLLVAILCGLLLLTSVHAAGQQYTVTYDANGGTSAPAAQTQDIGTALTLSTETPRRSGYLFKGWATSIYGEVVYTPGFGYTACKDVTLYAVWYKACSKCGGYGTALYTCSTCHGNGYYVSEYSSCCNAGVVTTIGNYGLTYSQCRSCGRVCSVNKKRYECPTSQRATCQTCRGDKYQKTSPPAPSMPELVSVTDDSITVVAQIGMEYSINGDNWLRSNTFTGLSSNTSYTVYQRYAGNSDYLPGAASPGLTVTTDKNTPSAPDAPVISTICHNEIHLQYDYPSVYEYSMDKVTWQENGSFRNLSPNTTYTFYQRKKATSTENASEPSPGVTATTARCGTLVIESVSGAPGETVTVNLTLSENPNFNYLKLYLEYDATSIEFVKATDTGILPNFSVEYDGYYVKIIWDGSSGNNNTQTGIIAVLTFKIKDRPQSTMPTIELFGYECYSQEHTNPGIIETNGTVSVACKTHSYGRWSADTEKHWRSCTICKYKDTADHSFANPCDSQCAVCHGYVRPSSHERFMNKDESKHWYECAICHTTGEKVYHIPGPEATEETAQVCKECSYVITPALKHKHEFASDLTANAQGHWYACSGCMEKLDYAAHRYENACSTACSDCGYSRQIQHQFSSVWASDANTHWYACSVCGVKSNEAVHVPGPDATETTAQTCTECGYELAPAVPNDPGTFGGNDTFPWTIIMVAAIVVSIAIGGCIVLIIMKKKK